MGFFFSITALESQVGDLGEPGLVLAGEGFGLGKGFTLAHAVE
jgi:hypothetical protein